MYERLEFERFIILLFALISVTMFVSIICIMGYVWLSSTTDFPHGTEYADGFDEEVFAAIVPGDQASTFLDKLGTPFHVSDYGTMKRVSYIEKDTLLYFNKSGQLYFSVDANGSPYKPWWSGITLESKYDSWGPPDDIKEGVQIKTRSYSRSPKYKNYKQRSLYIDTDLNIVVHKGDGLAR